MLCKLVAHHKVCVPIFKQKEITLLESSFWAFIRQQYIDNCWHSGREVFRNIASICSFRRCFGCLEVKLSFPHVLAILCTGWCWNCAKSRRTISEDETVWCVSTLTADVTSELDAHAQSDFFPSIDHCGMATQISHYLQALSARNSCLGGLRQPTGLRKCFQNRCPCISRRHQGSQNSTQNYCKTAVGCSWFAVDQCSHDCA